ncbi:MAG: PAS domain S-box protein [Phormidium sp. SL48-SHIP]|nr:MAG: PAS domain S-box protein [Phormidium sp. SL48-SHIP]
MYANSASDPCSFPTSELLEIFYHNSPMMMGIVELIEVDNHADIRFICNNSVTCQFFKVPPQSLAGKTFSELGIISESLSEFIEYYKISQQQSEPLSFEYEYFEGDQPCWLLVTLNYLHLGDQQQPQFSYLIRDISDRKQSELKRLEIERRNRELQLIEPIFEVILAGYWDWNLQENTEYLSPSFKKMFGYEDHELENSPETWEYLMFSEDFSETLEAIQNHINSPATVPFYREVRYRHKTGKTVWVICSGQVIEWDSEGRPSRMIGCHIDITNQKEAEQQLKRTNQEIKTFLDHAPILIGHLSPEGRYLNVNPALARRLGKSPDEIIGCSLADFLPDSTVCLFRQRLNIVKETMQTLKVEDSLYFEGQEQFFETILFPVIQEKEIINMWSIATDITTKKRQEIQLKQSEERYRQIIETTLEGVWCLDAQGRTELVNEQMAQMLGYSISEMLGKPLLDFASRDKHPEIEQKLKERQSGICEQHLFKFQHKDGSDVWVLVSTTPIHNAQGQYEGSIGLLTNITDMVQMQEALMVSELQLEGILNSSLDGIMAFRSVRNLQGEIIDFEYLLANTAACEIIQKPLENLVGNRLLNVMPGHREDGLFDYYVDVVESGNPGTREFHYNYDGLDFWFENIAVKLGDGFAVTFRDVTAMKHYQSTLEQTNQELELRLNDLRERHAEMLTLSQIGDFLQACVTVVEACQVVATLMEPLFPRCSGGIFLLNSSGHHLENIASWGDVLYSQSNFDIKDCWGLRRGRVHEVDDQQEGLRCRHIWQLPEDAKTCCIPLIAQGETLGLLYLSAHPAQVFPANKAQLARTVAEQLGLAIANLNLRTILEQQSIRDALTGLYNRRHFEDRLQQELERSSRTHSPLSLIMLDIDHFKTFNDTYGHNAGDYVLQSISYHLKASLRLCDIVCRYGGEELVIILPDTSLEAAQEIAEGLRQGIAALSLSYEEQLLGQVTASFGVASCPNQGASRLALVKASDGALYRAKRQGRNQVICAEDSTKS